MSPSIDISTSNVAADRVEDVEVPSRSFDNESQVDYDDGSSLPPTETPISTSSERMSHQFEDTASNEVSYQADVEIACGSFGNESEVDCDDDSSLLPTESLTSTSSEKMSHQLEDTASNEAAYQQADVENAFRSFRSVEHESEAAYKYAWLSSLTPAVPKAIENEKWAMRLPFSTWSKERSRAAALGCLCSFIVVSVRLVLDTKPMAYLLHSIVVLIDMLLIHLFTNSRWLSVGGEITTIIFFLAFHFTKETVFELLETTIIAMLCSFHLIASRNKHKEREEELEVGMTDFRRRRMVMLKTGPLQRAELGKFLQAEEEAEASEPHNPTLTGSTRTWFVVAKDHKECRRHVLTWGEHFFEYFLDGSAGVMYTSFLGLIISELLTYGDSKY